MHCIYNERVGGGTKGLILFIAPIPEATFLDNLSMCVCHRGFSSINIPSDLTEIIIRRILFILCMDPRSAPSNHALSSDARFASKYENVLARYYFRNGLKPYARTRTLAF